MKNSKNQIIFKLKLSFFALLATVLLIPSVSFADSYPTSTITLVAPYGAGGASDVAARTLTSVTDEYLDKPVQVINRVGASGTVGSEYVSTSDPDGYTLLLARVGCNAVAPALMPEDVPYKYDDFTMLGTLEENPFVYVVNPDSGIETLQDLEEHLHDKAGAALYATSGPGTMLHLGGLAALSAFGLDETAATAIPYDGDGEAATAVMAGEVDFAALNLGPAMSQIRGDGIKPIAVTTDDRVDEIKDVPTVSEAGYPDLEVVRGWSAIFGPPGLEDEVINVWSDVLEQVADNPTWQRLTISMGNIPSIRTPEETREFVDRQYEAVSEIAAMLEEELEL